MLAIIKWLFALINVLTNCGQDIGNGCDFTDRFEILQPLLKISQAA